MWKEKYFFYQDPYFALGQFGKSVAQKPTEPGPSSSRNRKKTTRKKREKKKEKEVEATSHLIDSSSYPFPPHKPRDAVLVPPPPPTSPRDPALPLLGFNRLAGLRVSR
jgi:hypothetical protein